MKKKSIKIVGLVISAMLILSMSVFAESDVKSDEKLTFEIGSAVFSQTDGYVTASIPVTFEGEMLVTAMQLQVSTEAGVEFVKYAQGDALEGIIAPKEGVTPVTIVFIDTSVTGVPLKSGTLATLEYRFPAKADKEYKLLLSAETVVNEKFEDIKDSVILKSGTVSIVSDASSGGAVIEETMTSEERKSDVLCMKIGKSTSIAYGKKRQIDENNRQVVPYISEDRTMVPLRYVAETLGADILWEEGWDGCIVKKGDKEIKFTFGSSEFFVNGEKITYDAPIEMFHDRTMVPLRFFSEQFGCDVYWESINSLVVISPIDNPWVAERKSEIRAINEMLISIYGIL